MTNCQGTSTGSFLDKHTIKVEVHGKAAQLLKGDVILIATGSSPRCPDIFPKDQHIYDSDSILQIKKMPKSMVVVGGGVIGCEYACIFSSLDVDVTLIHNRDILLPFLDHDISIALENAPADMILGFIPKHAMGDVTEMFSLALILGTCPFNQDCCLKLNIFGG